MSSDWLPTLNQTRSLGAPGGSPPFKLDRVSLLTFPVPADPVALQACCDRMINLGPDQQFVRARVAAPYVMIMVAHYPWVGVPNQPIGYFSQDELVFAVPIEWWRNGDRGWEYQGLAQITPFIFVSDPTSRVTGRQVYGWPKVHGELTGELPVWAKDPRGPRVLLNMQTEVLPQVFEGMAVEMRPFLQIRQNPPFSFTQMPRDMNGVQNPLRSAADAAEQWSAAWAHWARWGLGNLREPLIRDVPSFTQQAMSGSILNLKQFRDAERWENACFQALTRSAMDVTQVRQWGMLGDAEQLLQADPSGGFYIDLVDFGSLPIARSLGLIGTATTNLDGGVPGYLLRPFMPYWSELDLFYNVGETLCWRGREGAGVSPWQRGEVPPSQSTPPAARPLKPSQPQGGATELPTFSTFGSLGYQGLRPWVACEAITRVFVLRAVSATVRSYLQGNAERSLFGQIPPEDLRVEPAFDDGEEALVLMTVGTAEEMEAEPGNWPAQWVDFLIPVRVWVGDEARPRLGTVTAFGYCAHDAFALHAQETMGSHYIISEIEAEAGSWGSLAGPFAPLDPVLRVRASQPAGMYAMEPWEPRDLLAVAEVRGERVDQRAAFAELARRLGGVGGAGLDGWLQPVVGALAVLARETGSSQQLADALASLDGVEPDSDAVERILDDSGARGRLEALLAALVSLLPEDLAWADLAGATPRSVLVRVLDHAAGNTELGDPQRLATLAQQLISIPLETAVLVQGYPWSGFSFKQFPDAKDPTRACYQSVVQGASAFDPDPDWCEFATNELEVHVYRRPAQPIVEALGLICERRETGDAAEVAVLRPLIPVLHMLGRMDVRQSKVLCSRTGRDWVFTGH